MYRAQLGGRLSGKRAKGINARSVDGVECRVSETFAAGFTIYATGQFTVSDLNVVAIELAFECIARDAQNFGGTGLIATCITQHFLDQRRFNFREQGLIKTVRLGLTHVLEVLPYCQFYVLPERDGMVCLSCHFCRFFPKYCCAGGTSNIITMTGLVLTNF